MDPNCQQNSIETPIQSNYDLNDPHAQSIQTTNVQQPQYVNILNKNDNNNHIVDQKKSFEELDLMKNQNLHSNQLNKNQNDIQNSYYHNNSNYPNIHMPMTSNNIKFNSQLNHPNENPRSHQILGNDNKNLQTANVYATPHGQHNGNPTNEMQYNRSTNPLYPYQLNNNNWNQQQLLFWQQQQQQQQYQQQTNLNSNRIPNYNTNTSYEHGVSSLSKNYQDYYQNQYYYNQNPLLNTNHNNVQRDIANKPMISSHYSSNVQNGQNYRFINQESNPTELNLPNSLAKTNPSSHMMPMIGEEEFSKKFQSEIEKYFQKISNVSSLSKNLNENEDENHHNKHKNQHLEMIDKNVKHCEDPQNTTHDIYEIDDVLSSISLKKQKKPKSNNEHKTNKNVVSMKHGLSKISKTNKIKKQYQDSKYEELIVNSLNSPSNYNSQSSESFLQNQCDEKNKNNSNHSQYSKMLHHGSKLLRNPETNIYENSLSSSSRSKNNSNYLMENSRIRNNHQHHSQSSPNIVSSGSMLNSKDINLTRLFQTNLRLNNLFPNHNINSSNLSGNASLHQIHAIGWNMMQLSKSFSLFPIESAMQNLYYSETQQLRRFDNQNRFFKFIDEKQINQNLTRKFSGPFDGFIFHNHEINDGPKYEESVSYCELRSNKLINNFTSFSLDKQSLLALWTMIKFGPKSFVNRPMQQSQTSSIHISRLFDQMYTSLANDINNNNLSISLPQHRFNDLLLLFQNQNFDQICPFTRHDLSQLFFNYFKDIHFPEICRLSSKIVSNSLFCDILDASIDQKLIIGLIQSKRQIIIDELIINEDFNAISLSLAHAISIFNQSTNNNNRSSQSSIDIESPLNQIIRSFLSKQASSGYMLFPLIISLLSGHLYCSANDLLFQRHDIVIKYWPLFLSILISCCNSSSVSSLSIVVALLKTMIKTLESHQDIFHNNNNISQTKNNHQTNMAFSASLCRLVLLLISPENFLSTYESFIDHILTMDFIVDPNLILSSSMTSNTNNNNNNILKDDQIQDNQSHNQHHQSFASNGSIKQYPASRYLMHQLQFQESLSIAELINLILSHSYKWLLDRSLNSNINSFGFIIPKLRNYNHAKIQMALILYKHGFPHQSLQYIRSILLSYDEPLFSYDHDQRHICDMECKDANVALWLQVIDLGLSLSSSYCESISLNCQKLSQNNDNGTLNNENISNKMQSSMSHTKQLYEHENRCDYHKYLDLRNLLRYVAQKFRNSIIKNNSNQNYDFDDKKKILDQKQDLIGVSNKTADEKSFGATSSPITSSSSSLNDAQNTKKTKDTNQNKDLKLKDSNSKSVVDKKKDNHSNNEFLDEKTENDEKTTLIEDPNLIMTFNNEIQSDKNGHKQSHQVVSIDKKNDNNNNFDFNNVFVVSKEEKSHDEHIIDEDDKKPIEYHEMIASKHTDSNSVKDFYKDSNPFTKKASNENKSSTTNQSFVDKLRKSVTGLMSGSKIISNSNNIDKNLSQFNPGGIPDCDPNLMPPSIGMMKQDITSKLKNQSETQQSTSLEANYVNYFDF